MLDVTLLFLKFTKSDRQKHPLHHNKIGDRDSIFNDVNSSRDVTFLRLL